ncbi:MAG TPA: dTDP-glucose 4,6-dehydratase [Gammaproteobacteria bacterium]|nr:dTDP-glucose 4,6-dehydratase [Gammaproteobacteria bacterium]
MKIFQPKQLLVTGGAGFIGSNFVCYLLKHYPDLSIINLDKLTYAGSKNNLREVAALSQHIFVEGDIANADLVGSLLRKYEIDTVVHFAAESHVDRSIQGPAAFIQTNVVGTFTLLEAVRHYWLLEKKLSGDTCRFHHISTDEVYGALGSQDDPFSEHSPYLPNSPYSASKAGSDHLVRAYAHTYGLPVTISNCSNNYGPHQHQEKFIPTVIRACFNQQPIPIYGNGSHIRDWLYVEDHCRAIDLILRQGQLGRSYNIGANNEWSNLELVHYLAQYMDARYPAQKPYAQLIKYVPDRPGHDWRYAINDDRIKTELAWKPLCSFETGIEKTISFLEDHLIGFVEVAIA